jgi:hypothetical protein
MCKQIVNIMFKSIPKPSTNNSKPILKTMRTDIEKDHQRYHQHCDWGSHFGAICISVSCSGASSSRPDFRNLCGAPQGPILASLGARLERFSKFSDEFRSHVSPDINDFKASFPFFVNKWHQQHLQQTKKRKTCHTKIQPAIFFVLLNPRKSETPGPFK